MSYLFVQATAPYLAMAISLVCLVAAIRIQLAERSRMGHGKTFGRWPPPSCPEAASSPGRPEGRTSRSACSAAPAGRFPGINRAKTRPARPHRPDFNTSAKAPPATGRSERTARAARKQIQSNLFRRTFPYRSFKS